MVFVQLFLGSGRNQEGKCWTLILYAKGVGGWTIAETRTKRELLKIRAMIHRRLATWRAPSTGDYLSQLLRVCQSAVPVVA